MISFETFRKKTVEFIIERPKETLIIFFALSMALAAGALKLETDFSYKVWYNENDPLVKLYQKFEQNFGNDDAVVVGLYSPKGIFTPNAVKALSSLTDEFYQVSDIIRVDTVLNFNDIKADGDDINISPILPEELQDTPTKEGLAKAKDLALTNSMLVNSFINEEGTFAILSAQVRPAHDSTPDYQQITTETYALLDKYRNQYPDLELISTGPVILTDSFRSITIEDMGRLIPLLYGVFTIILIYLFRSFAGVFLPYITITFSTLMMVGTMGYMGLSINTLSAANPTILLTVALADAIHILTVYYLALRNGYQKREALKHTLVKNFYPTLLTTITTALGFLSFFDAKIKPVSSLGISVGIGALYAWVAAYALMGPLLAFLPTRVKNSVDNKPKGGHDIPASKRAKSFAKLIHKKHKMILALSIILGGFGLYYSTKLVVNMDPLEQFPSDHPITKSYKAIQKHMDYIGTIEVMVTADGPGLAKDPAFLKKVDELQKWIAELPYTKNVMSINDYLKQINQAFNAGDNTYYRLPPTSSHIAQEIFFYSMGLPPEQPIENRINAARDAVRLTINWKLKTSLESNKAYKEINQKAKELGLNAKVTGKTPLFHDLTPYVVSTFIKSFSIALVTITVALSLILQSFRLGMFAMIPSILPLVIGSGLFALSGHHIDMGTVLVASVCLGIAVDDSVHFMFAYKRLRADHDFESSLATIVTNVYPSLFNTTILLALGFSSFILGNYMPNTKFGVACSGVLLIALLCDFLVLPALIAFFDKKKAAQ